MTNFEQTLNMIQTDLNRRLTNGYHRLWVQGYNSPKGTTILFTVFNRDGYKMEFLRVQNFRQYRPEGDQAEELEILNRHIQSFRTLLSDYVDYGTV